MKLSLPHMSYIPSATAGSAASSYHFLMMTEALTIPDGNLATIHEMVAAQKNIQEFVIAAEAGLRDVDDVMLHNFVVDQLHDLATLYKQQLNLFAARHAKH